MTLAALSLLTNIVLGLALLQALLLWLWTYENTRYFRSRLRSRPADEFTPRVHLFMPCKGCEPRFVETVRGMLAQDYPAYRTTFVVESPSDPAYGELTRLVRESACASAEVIVAGAAHECGQKVHNLLVATDRLDALAQVVVFADSDILPDVWWLRRLVAPLARTRTGVVTGYRWFFAEHGSWAGTLLAALNSTVTFALGNHSWNQVWGGSWAIRRGTFDDLRQAQLWDGALTEDLQVGQFVRSRGEYVAYEPSCLVASPVHGNWRTLAEFARRQYLITRVYAPRFWWLGLLATTFAQTVFWGGVIGAAFAVALGQPLGSTGWILLAIYSVNTIRALLRQRAIHARFPKESRAQRAVWWLDVLGHPLVGLVQWCLIVSSAWGREITWRSIRYRLQGPHHTRVLHRTTPRQHTPPLASSASS